MSRNSQLDSFDRRVRDAWEQRGYDVVPEAQGLVATRDDEMRLLETFPGGDVTAADVDDAVARLIESTELSHITLVVGGEVPPALREQTEQWDVTLVSESELRGSTEPGDERAGDGPTEDGPETETTPDSAPPGGVPDPAADGIEDGGERPAFRWEVGALALEVLLVLLLAGTLGYLLVQATLFL
jgi:hypothetical protein